MEGEGNSIPFTRRVSAGDCHMGVASSPSDGPCRGSFVRTCLTFLSEISSLRCEQISICNWLSGLLTDFLQAVAFEGEASPNFVRKLRNASLFFCPRAHRTLRLPRPAVPVRPSLGASCFVLSDNDLGPNPQSDRGQGCGSSESVSRGVAFSRDILLARTLRLFGRRVACGDDGASQWMHRSITSHG